MQLRFRVGEAGLCNLSAQFTVLFSVESESVADSGGLLYLVLKLSWSHCWLLLLMLRLVTRVAATSCATATTATLSVATIS